MDRMHLNLFTMNAVTHVSPGAWRRPGDRAADYTEREYWTGVARTAERGGFDAVFFADVRGIYDVFGESRDPAVEKAVQTPSNDPRFLIPAMAEVTEDLGFAVTRSTTYNHPYELAREFTTLDHITDGRVAFNIVTSYLESAARNLGVGERLDHDDRYDRATEFMTVCYALWEDSWDDDAIANDPEAGVFARPEGVHEINHDGEWFSVQGPHGCEPSPQRTPYLYQAGASDRGREFAAHNAEAVFCSYPTKAGVRDYVADLRKRARDHGRDPDSLGFYPGVVPIVAESEELAATKHETYRDHVDVEAVLALLSGFMDMDLSELDPDQAVEHIETEAIQGAVDAFTTADPDRDWTVAEMARFAGLGSTSPIIVGTPTTVADKLEAWYRELPIAGFNVKEVARPDSLDDFVNLVAPELRERGLLGEADGTTLRDQAGGQGRRLPNDHPARR